MEGPSRRGGSGGRDVNTLLRHYKLGRTIGRGSFAEVKIAEHVFTGLKVAIKIIGRRKIKNTIMENKVMREAKILKLLRHPHIVRFYEVIETPAAIHIVMEYVKYGELYYYIVEKGRLQEDEARNFFQQIISGVEHCHQNMVVHRDLKLENLLLDSKLNVKIADFGFSNIIRDGRFLKTSCGSRNYAAPELQSGKLYAGPEVDVWSCGVILYVLLCSCLPFDEDEHNSSLLLQKIKGGIYTLPNHLSPGARDLISRMLMVDPLKRVTIPEIRHHQWFQANLPLNLTLPSPNTTRRVKKIDDGIVQAAIKIGFERNQLIESLLNRVQNEATVTYYLLLDNRIQASSDYHGAEFQETMESCSNLIHPAEVISPAAGHVPVNMNYRGMSVPIEKKWALGLQSRANPHEIMTRVVEALQELNVGWKKIGIYNMKCRWMPPILNNSMDMNHISMVEADDGFVKPQNVVKFEVQLYKAGESYLLDLQRVQGPHFLYLDLCAIFLKQLRVF